MSYKDIIERLSNAEGPDRKIDIAIGKLLPPERIESDGSWHEENDMVRFPVVTASIDASLALVGRMLPGWARGFDAGPKTIIAFVDRHDFSDRMFGAKYTAEAPTAPLAILLALFKALEAKERGE